MYKKERIRHSQGVVDMSVRSGERGDEVIYEDEELVIGLRELDRLVEEEEKSKKNLRMEDGEN